MSRGRSRAKPEEVQARRVPVTVTVEQAMEVVLTGEFTGWALDRVRLEKGEGGAWRTELLLLPGRYECRLRVDGAWRNDPGCSTRVPNAFGTQNDVLVVE